MDLKFKLVHFALGVLFLAQFGKFHIGTFDANSYGDISEVSHEFIFLII